MSLSTVPKYMGIFELFKRYKLSYDEVSLILQKCTKSKDSKLAKQIHGMLITNGSDLSQMSVDAKILGVYASCGNVGYARQLFDKMRTPNVFATNWMISVMAFNGYNSEAIGYFSFSRKLGNLPNKYTFSFVLKACVGLLDLNKGREVHAVINKMGCECETLVCNALIDMYGKCSKIEYGRRLFDWMPVRDVATWTSMISGYCNRGQLDEAVVLFKQMKLNGLEPNDFTWNALIAGFAQSGDRVRALELFSQMSEAGLGTDLVSWNALISGFGRSSQPVKALDFFGQMLVSGIKPNHVTVTGVLPVCGVIGSIKRGRELHGLIFRLALENNVYVANAVIDMYSKCGCVKSARNVFDITHVRNVALWNVIIGCLWRHGMVNDSLLLFEKMLEGGFRPNEVTLVSVLSACSHGGLVEKGMEIFRSMKEKYKVEAGKEHYGCVVDLLCRAGKVEEAHEIIKRMSMAPTESILGSFFNGCIIHGRRDLAEDVAKNLSEDDPQKTAALVTLSNIYAGEKKWQEVQNVRNIMKGKGFNKNPGFSSVERKKE
ncbi:pentatricopeptide repeat-containing protein At5g59600-like [Silene latifolia]|uniref:pentatricopeptide repeat-containing protein At5g59600-like n=1 Tax=Silene latifolia TaxID=37657 RepID=UPI003D7852E8